MTRPSRALAPAPTLAFVAGAALGSACDKPPSIDRERAATLFTEVAVDTAPGLSGLAIDDAGWLWTVAERAARAYRIALDPGLQPTIETFPVEGLPPHTDLEAIAALGGGRFALGAEGHHDGVATVALAERRGTTLAVTRTIELPEHSVGIPLANNHGTEGICGAGETIIAAVEGAGFASGRRWAPVLRITSGAITRAHRMWLTTPTGKLSGLDCVIAPDGTVTGWAVERHFEVTRLLRFTLPAPGSGDDEITPAVALDLGPILRGRLNLEGIARLPDGRIVTVVDNQWKTIAGPSELLVFRAGVVP